MSKSSSAYASLFDRNRVARKTSADIARERTDYRQVIQRAQVDPGSLTAQDVLTLQRSIGNRATVRLMQPVLQAKLKLGPAGDQYEQEADRVAAQVVGGALPSAEGGAVQRDLEDEEMIQGKEMHGPEGGEVDASVQGQIQAARGGGKPLDEGVRRQMERGFGADFSGVRVHTGQQADTLNRSLNARAFTTGKDIFFGKGEYQPKTFGGKKLLAHELTHTVQQSGVGLQRAPLDDSRVAVQRDFDGYHNDSAVIRKFVVKVSYFLDNIDNIENGLAPAASLNLQMPDRIDDDGLRAALQNWIDEFNKVSRLVDNPAALMLNLTQEEAASQAKAAAHGRYMTKTNRSVEKYRKAKAKHSITTFYHKSKAKSRSKKAAAVRNGASFTDFMNDQAMVRGAYDLKVVKAAQAVIQPFQEAHQHLGQLYGNAFDLELRADVPGSLLREVALQIRLVSGTD
jgi:hypothetical protein